MKLGFKLNLITLVKKITDTFKTEDSRGLVRMLHCILNKTALIIFILNLTASIIKITDILKTENSLAIG